jgi:hypothetical protein
MQHNNSRSKSQSNGKRCDDIENRDSFVVIGSEIDTPQSTVINNTKLSSFEQNKSSYKYTINARDV